MNYDFLEALTFDAVLAATRRPKSEQLRYFGVDEVVPRADNRTLNDEGPQHLGRPVIPAAVDPYSLE